jgi:hypothetical protein
MRLPCCSSKVVQLLQNPMLQQSYNSWYREPSSSSKQHSQLHNQQQPPLSSRRSSR